MYSGKSQVRDNRPNKTEPGASWEVPNKPKPRPFRRVSAGNYVTGWKG